MKGESPRWDVDRRDPDRPAGPDPLASHYRALFEAAPDGILIVDARGLILDANRQAHRLFGYAEDGLVGMTVEALVPEGSREAHTRHRERFMEELDPRPMGVGLELAGMRSDGTRFPVEISLSPLATERGPMVIAIVRDLTDRNRLREFGVTALRAAEDERQRIARELHDDTAQRLAALLLRLRLLPLHDDPERREALVAEMRRELQETAESVRRIARGLRPPVLSDAGVVMAIQSHLWNLLDATGLKAEAQLAPVDDLLTEDAKLVLYRVVQEALSNVVRHAGASRVRVRVAAEDETVVGLVEDDGWGFDPAAAMLEGEGLGLMGMRERAAAVGGEVTVESAPGRGARVRVELPRAEADHAERGDGGQRELRPRRGNP